MAVGSRRWLVHVLLSLRFRVASRETAATPLTRPQNRFQKCNEWCSQFFCLCSFYVQLRCAVALMLQHFPTGWVLPWCSSFGQKHQWPSLTLPAEHGFFTPSTHPALNMYLSSHHSLTWACDAGATSSLIALLDWTMPFCAKHSVSHFSVCRHWDAE